MQASSADLVRNKKEKPPTNGTTLGSKPDMFKINKWYALTVSPDDDRQNGLNPQRIHKMHKYYRRFIKRSHQNGTMIELNPEITTPTSHNNKHPRYHFHGRIKFTMKGLLYWYTIDWSHWLEHARIDIDTMNTKADEKIWKGYCEKNKVLMLMFHNELGISYPTHAHVHEENTTLRFNAPSKTD